MQSQALFVLFTLLMFPAVSHSESACDAPPLSDDGVKAAIDTARATRSDLPSPFAESRWSVKRLGCYYVFLEVSLPEAPDSNHMITLDPHGAIVDVQAGGRSSQLECPSKVFSETELAEIIRSERAKRSDLPAAFESSRIQVSRMRCLYLYFEHKVPEQRGDYQVFTIDPLGGVMEFSRSEPY